MRKSIATYNLTNRYYRRTPKNDASFNIIEEIGDSKDTKFQPQLKVMGWDNECNVSFRLITDGNDSHTQDTNGSIITKSGKLESALYPIDDIGEYGGHEFETLILSKPNSNVLKYSIQSKNVEFHYQGELTADDIASGCHRPENVIDSYAVYGNGRNNDINGKHYLTGKLMHIYRPFAVDTNGIKVWCKLNINSAGSLMTITIPQDFIDNAKYPILVDPTLGYTSAGGTTSGNAQPWAHGVYSLPADVRVVSGSIYGKDSGVPFILGIYSDNSGTINNLIVSSSGGTFSAIAEWQTVSFVYINNSVQDIWIAHNAGTVSTCTLYYDNVQTGYTWVSDSNGAHNFSYPNLYSPFVVNTTVANRRHSLYITYNIPTGLPTNLPLLDYTIYNSPLLPKSKSSINLELLDFVQFGNPFAVNNTKRISKTSSANFSFVSKLSSVSKSTISKISGVSL